MLITCLSLLCLTTVKLLRGERHVDRNHLILSNFTSTENWAEQSIATLYSTSGFFWGYLSHFPLFIQHKVNLAGPLNPYWTTKLILLQRYTNRSNTINQKSRKKMAHYIRFKNTKHNPTAPYHNIHILSLHKPSLSSRTTLCSFVSSASYPRSA